jgi:hypothetical protein
MIRCFKREDYWHKFMKINSMNIFMTTHFSACMISREGVGGSFRSSFSFKQSFPGTPSNISHFTKVSFETMSN